MKDLSLKTVVLTLVTLTFLMFAHGCSRRFDDKVVSVEERELTVAQGPAGTLKTHQVASNAVVVLNGELAKLEQIQPGDLVDVTVQTQGVREFVVRVAARRP